MKNIFPTENNGALVQIQIAGYYMDHSICLQSVVNRCGVFVVFKIGPLFPVYVFFI